MSKEQGKLHQVKRTELLFKTTKRPRNTVDDVLGGKVLLELVDIGAQLLQFLMLAFRDSPDEQRDTTPVLGEVSRHRLADKHPREIGNPEATLNAVVIREGHKIHSGISQFAMQFPGIGHAGRNLKAAQQPLGRKPAVAGVKVKVDACHDFYSKRSGTLMLDVPPLVEPIPIGCDLAPYRGKTDAGKGMAPNAGVLPVRGMESDSQKWGSPQLLEQDFIP
jgi:hypothetical protein